MSNRPLMTFVQVFTCLAVLSCSSKKEKTRQQNEVGTFPTVGAWERLDPALDEVVDLELKAEIIATGFDWSEGPLWLESEDKLIFSDVPQNTIYQWSESEGTSVYLKPSGYTGSTERGGEMGSNGLLLNEEGKLVLCQHGNRQMAFMNAALSEPQPDFVSLAAHYEGKRFNSPNDAVFDARGELFFTDPPYGLEKQMADTAKDIPFQGVYHVTLAGEVNLVTDQLTRPNGAAFLSGDSTLIIANSDPGDPAWYAFDRNKNGDFSAPRVFYRVLDYQFSIPGLPDGLKVDRKGNVFATGPGGLWVFDHEGKLLGKYILPEATSNCALSPDENTIYITNDGQVLRLKLR